MRVLVTSVPFTPLDKTLLVLWPCECARATELRETAKPYGLLRLKRTAQRQCALLAGQSTLTFTGDLNCSAPEAPCCGCASTRNDVGAGLAGSAVTAGRGVFAVVVAVTVVVVVVDGRGSGMECTADTFSQCVTQRKGA